MIQSQVPELADGGYWYVTSIPSFVDEDGEEATAYSGEHSAFFITLEGELLAVIRVSQPIAFLPPLPFLSVKKLLAARGDTSKPFARIGGV